MARYLPPDHFCPWREEAEELRERLTTVEARVEELQRRVFGRSSERLPPVSKELRQGQSDETARQAAQDKRRERAAARAALPSPQVHHPVPPEERACPRCGGTELKPLGRGKRSVLYEYVPPSPEGACASCAAPPPGANDGFPLLWPCLLPGDRARRPCDTRQRDPDGL